MNDFAVSMWKFSVSILKGEILNPSNINKYDIITNNSELEIIMLHMNNNLLVCDIPERCFQIDFKSKPALRGASTGYEKCFITCRVR